MPYIVKGEPSSWKESYTEKEDYKYSYPDNLDLKPGSDLHNEIRDKVWQRANESRHEISKRFPYWRDIDRMLTAYIPLKDKEKAAKEKDSTEPVSIVFPYTYSIMESLLTYLTIAFFQDPIFQYEGVEDDDVVGAMLLEMIIRIHCIKTKVPLAIHTVLRDSLAYGVGIGIPGWKKIYGKKPVKSVIQTISDIGTQESMDIEMVEDLLFEGNQLSNIEPYMWLPDPSVSSNNIQDGEFVGWIDRDNYMNLLSEESQPEQGLFNVRYLKHKKDKRSTLALDQSDRETRHGGSSELNRSMTNTTNPVDVIKMYITIIPKDWKLGDSEYPEKWYFELASDDILIACERADHNHGMYPVGVASPEADGYSITPIGRLEVLNGLQDILNFEFNSHAANVKKAINDTLIVDPYLVNINDLKDPRPGALVRLRRPAWGRGVDKVVKQLVVNDITRANIADANYITQIMDRTSGADQSMQGSLRQGGPERLTSAEFRGTRGSSISRLQHISMLIGMQFMQDIGTMFAVHTQQYMSQEAVLRITGRNEEKLRGILGGVNSKRISIYDIAINYDLIVRDGSIPGGNFSESWIDLFKVIGTSQELMQQFDVAKIFTYIAYQLGAKNVDDFKRNLNRTQAQTMPDQQVQQEVQRGNLVPIGA